MTSRAVLFDLDGTLTDTLRDLAECTNEVLHANGFPTHPLDAYRRFVGSGIRKLLERALGTRATEETVSTLHAQFVPLYDRECLRYVSLYDGIADAVAMLKAEGVRLAVVTNKPEVQARKIVAHLFPADTFAVVYGNVSDRPIKPHPAVTQLALDALGVSANHAIFVGDSDVDVFTADNVHIPCIGCTWGFRGEQELAKAGAAYLANTPADILTAFHDWKAT